MAYILFCKEFRPTLPSDLSFGDASKRCGEAWKALEDKSKYLALAEEQKANRPPSEKANKKKKKSDGTEGSKKKKKSDDTEGPKKKRALSGYLVFSMEQRANVKTEHPDATPKEILGLLGTAWKALSEKEKAEYNTKAKASNDSSAGPSTDPTEAEDKTE